MHYLGAIYYANPINLRFIDKDYKMKIYLDASIERYFLNLADRLKFDKFIFKTNILTFKVKKVSFGSWTRDLGKNLDLENLRAGKKYGKIRKNEKITGNLKLLNVDNDRSNGL